MSDEINTNAEYVPENELDLIEEKGNEDTLLDTPEQDQDPVAIEEEGETGQRALRKAIEGDPELDQETILDNDE